MTPKAVSSILCILDLTALLPNRVTFEYSYSVSSIGRKPTNRAVVLKSRCIRSMTRFPENRATLDW